MRTSALRAGAALLAGGVLLTGCYASHGDARDGRDAGVRDAGGGACARAAVDLRVSVELREGPVGSGCALGPLRGDWQGVEARGDRLEITLDTCVGCESPNRCVLVVEGLHPVTAAAMGTELAEGRWRDVWADASANGLNVRDTSLCDGPAAPECPLLARVGVSDLAGHEDAEVDFSWDQLRCRVDGPLCAEEVRALAVNGIEPVRVARVEQGGTTTVDPGPRALRVSSSASTEIPCVDEPRLAEWAAWRR